MSIEASTATFRERTRFTTTGRPVRTARQITIPGTDVEVTRTQAALGAGVAVLGLLLLTRGGGRRRGFEITDIGA